MAAPSNGYGRTAISLHWAVATLIGIALVLAWVLPQAERSRLQHAAGAAQVGGAAGPAAGRPQARLASYQSRAAGAGADAARIAGIGADPRPAVHGHDRDTADRLPLQLGGRAEPVLLRPGDLRFAAGRPTGPSRGRWNSCTRPGNGRSMAWSACMCWPLSIIISSSATACCSACCRSFGAGPERTDPDRFAVIRRSHL